MRSFHAIDKPIVLSAVSQTLPIKVISAGPHQGTGEQRYSFVISGCIANKCMSSLIATFSQTKNVAKMADV
jgi:hypothetical protein